MSAFIRQVAIKGLQFLRAFWIILGISFAMFVLAESCYRAQDSLRSAVSSRLVRSRRGPAAPTAAPAAAPAPVHPVAAEAWYPEFSREFEEASQQGWRPYVYFRRARAYQGKYVNIDSLRHRITPQPRTPATPLASVFFFGGSTLWGSFQRDDHTIPAEAARRLQSIAPPGQRIEVTNLAETGYVSTQGMLELMLQLRAGQRPDVVVFFDGINDTFSVLQNGEAGVGQNEMNRVSEFLTGRRLAWSGHDEGLMKDLHSYGVLAIMGLERTRLVQRLQKAVRPSAERPLLSTDSAARSAVRVYVENVRIIESLARTYGFTPIYVWQPTLHATQKKLTPFEQRLMSRIRSDEFQRRLQATHLAVLPLLDSAVATVAPGRFVNEGRLFRDDSLPVFTDQVGHNTERSIPTIVDGFWPTLKAAIEARGKQVAPTGARSATEGPALPAKRMP
jgi:lysophospholipase L1-like esterase